MKDIKELQALGFVNGIIPNSLSNMQIKAYNETIKDKLFTKNGKLEALAYDPNHIAKKLVINPITRPSTTLLCRCDCGNFVYVRTTDFNTSKTRSCGCWHDQNAKTLNRFCYKHGDTGTRLYNILWGMIRRCYNKNDQNYPNYGGRGIKVCDEWYTPDDHTIGWLRFKEWAYSNGYNDSLSIDRIDVNGDYEPSNCRWVNSKTQSENTRINHRITLYGKYISTTEFAHKIDMFRSDRIPSRIHNGWSDFDAATIPMKSVRHILGHTESIPEYTGPRYDSDGILRDSDGFIVLIPKIKKKGK